MTISTIFPLDGHKTGEIPPVAWKQKAAINGAAESTSKSTSPPPQPLEPFVSQIWQRWAHNQPKMADYSIKLSKTKEMERLVDLEVDSQSPLASIYGRTKGRLRSRLSKSTSPDLSHFLSKDKRRPQKLYFTANKTTHDS